MKKYFGLIFLFVLQAASAQTDSQISERNALDALTKATTNLSAENLSCQLDEDCKNVEMGSKACGGPQFYLLASTLNHNHTIIKFMAEQTVSREREYNIRFEIISDCSTPIEVTTRCSQNICTY